MARLVLRVLAVETDVADLVVFPSFCCVLEIIRTFAGENSQGSSERRLSAIGTWLFFF